MSEFYFPQTQFYWNGMWWRHPPVRKDQGCNCDHCRATAGEDIFDAEPESKEPDWPDQKTRAMVLGLASEVIHNTGAIVTNAGNKRIDLTFPDMPGVRMAIWCE